MAGSPSLPGSGHHRYFFQNPPQVGTQNTDLLDARSTDEDEEAMLPLTIEEGVDATATAPLDALTSGVVSAIGASGSEAEYHQRAAEVYREYSKHFGDDGGRPQRLRAFP